MWLLTRQPNPRLESLIIGDYPSAASRVTWRGEERVGHHIPDEHPAAAFARDLLRGGFPADAAGDTEVVPVDAAPVEDPQAAEDRRTREALVAQAILRGWSAEELEGTWDGGRLMARDTMSRHTGLTLMEMVLSHPPEDWPALKAAAKAPWDSLYWTPPNPGWVAPTWTSPVPKPVERSRSPVVVVRDDGALDSGEALEGAPRSGDEEADEERTALFADLVRDDDATVVTVRDEGIDEAEMVVEVDLAEMVAAAAADPYGYPEEHREAMRALVVRLHKASRGGFVALG
ncbi:MAG: hypothetical protein VKL39_24025, partial [Leptolyngbyaceae bacterium]|nr:hypothetical protein [Leptolyngbyaceae bacterium]